MDRLTITLKATKNLVQGWDSYSAPPPSEWAYNMAEAALEKAREINFLPTALFPSADGGIALCWDKAEKHAYIEYDNDLEAIVAIYTNNGDPEIKEITSETDLLSAFDSIRAFMRPRSLDRIGLFDMDGSTADFEKALHASLNSMRSPTEPPLPDNLYEIEDLPHIKARMKSIKSVPGWWLNLERIEMGFTVVRMAEEIGYNINVLTKGPNNNSLAWKEKVDWIAQQPEFKDKKDHIHITMNKGLIYGTFLYDDYPVYMDAWLANRPRGLGIMPITPSNKDYSHPQVIRWDGTNIDEVRRALETAYTREFLSPLVLKNSSVKQDLNNGRG